MNMNNNMKLLITGGAVVIAVFVGGWYLGTHSTDQVVTVEQENSIATDSEPTEDSVPVPSEEIASEEVRDAALSEDTATTPAKTAPTTPAPVTKTITYTPPVTTTTPKPKLALVTYDGRGFSPKKLTILKGDTVRFLNISSDGMWVVTNIHPTHKSYPVKTTKSCSGTIFDMCKEVQNGQYWDFTFDREGTFGYHNEIKPVMDGSIEVNLVGEKPATGGDY